MSDPERLIEGGSSFEQALLSSAAHDRGSDRAARRTLGAVAAALASATPGISSAAPAAVLIAKWTGVGALAGVAATSVLEVARHEPVVTRSEAASAPLPVRTPPRKVAPPHPEATTPAAPLAPSSAAAPAPPGPARVGTAPRGRAAPADSLSAELALLDEARQAIARRQPLRALSLVDRHRALFGSGVLGPEALLVRIEALLLAGKRAAAERLAAEQLARTPDGPHADRIRSLLERSEP